MTVDPVNPDVVYVTGQSIRRSDDGGRTLHFFKGAPGGDDYHFLWINPKNPQLMVTAADQGTVVSVNGGKTWSGWYNQPTGQFYHVETDDRFPYWIYSGQQDSGTAGAATRSDYGSLTFRDWHPVGGEERGWDVPDPKDPLIVYGSGLGGTITRYDGRTGEVRNVSPSVESSYGRRPTAGTYRWAWAFPIAIAKKAPYTMYTGSQYLLRSPDRGVTWEKASPDLTGAVADAKDCAGEVTVQNARPCGFGVIWTIEISPRDPAEIWVGTDSGLVQLTRDGGKNWKDVTPRGLPAWAKVASVDVSALDGGAAYVAVDGHRLDEFSPRLYKTRDYGATWTEIASGLPAGRFTTVVRADPVRRGLLYAGTDSGAFVSFDDGASWQPLSLNLPTAWVGDLAVHGNDLVAATQGRALWVLDDVTPLRQLQAETAREPVHLFAPAEAIRVRANENRDTPLPPEVPIAHNPPAGAVIDYVVGSGMRGPLTLEILDAQRLAGARLRERRGPREVRRATLLHGTLAPVAGSVGDDTGTPSVRLGLAVCAPRGRGIRVHDAGGRRRRHADRTARTARPSRAIHGPADGSGEALRAAAHASPRSADLRSRIGLHGEARDAAEGRRRDELLVRGPRGGARRSQGAPEPDADAWGGHAGPRDPAAALEADLARTNRTLSAILNQLDAADAPATAAQAASLKETLDALGAQEARWKTLSAGR